ncbi:MAG: outer membrane protein transport protein [Vicinamibacterales bacterium]|nr:outer membrane protein transport protein [Vicinamibacterales bacterium]
MRRMGRGTAGVASPCDDGSAIYNNPAALAVKPERLVGVGAMLIGPRGDYASFAGDVRGEFAPNWYPVPSAYFAMPVGERASVGIGVFAPFGLTTEWNEGFEGRFVAYKVTLQSPFVQPTFAWRPSDALAIGAGLDITYSRLELNQRVDLSTQQLAPGVTFGMLGVPRFTEFADFRISGHKLTFGGNVGVILNPDGPVSFGARYLTRQTIEADDLDLETRQIATGLRTPVPLPGIPAGTPIDALLAPQFQAGGRLSNQGAATELTLPDQLAVGIAFRPTQTVKVLADYWWTNWSEFESLEFVTENGLEEVIDKQYEDSAAFRFGVDVEASDTMTLRGGLVLHDAAAPDGSITPDLPEGGRWLVSAGLGVRVSSSVRMDLAYMYLRQQDREGRTQLTGPDTGTYTFNANLFGASLVWRF